MLADVPHTFALVRLGRTQLADLGGHLAHELLIDPANGDDVLVLLVRDDLDSLGDGKINGVAVTQVQDHRLSFYLRLVTNPDDLQLLLVPGTYAQRHVLNQHPRESVASPGCATVIFAIHLHTAAIHFHHHFRQKLILHFSLWAFDRNGGARDRDSHSAGQGHWFFSN